MIESDKPNRSELAEISATANEGADCFIMTKETSKGKFGELATIHVAKAIAEAESVVDYEQSFINIREGLKQQGENVENMDLIANTGCAIGFEPKENVDMFSCMTETGKMA